MSNKKIDIDKIYRYNYVYMVLNLVNDKYYLGKHSTNNFYDGYMGSGIAIGRAKEKYGLENFQKEIIAFFDNEEAAYVFEYEIISEHFNKENCYNIAPGGYGISNLTFEQRSNNSKEYNSDRVWITNGVDDKRIKTNHEMPDGYYFGRINLDLSSRIGLKRWTDGNVQVLARECPGPKFENRIDKETPTAFLNWWNNGIINKRSKICPDGFVSGRLKWKSKIVTCPHCGKEGGETAMKRHHFDHCKMRIYE